MTFFHAKRKAPPCLPPRRLLAILTISSLLTAQQGVSFYAEAARIVSGQGATAGPLRFPPSSGPMGSPGTSIPAGIPALSAPVLPSWGNLAAPPGGRVLSAAPGAAVSALPAATPPALPASVPRTEAGALSGGLRPASPPAPARRAAALGGEARRAPMGTPGARKNGAPARPALRGLKALQGDVRPESASRAFDGVRVYLTADGREPAAAAIEDLGELDVSALNEEGRVRVVLTKKDLPGGLRKEDVEELRRELAGRGVEAPLDVEYIPIDWKRKAGREAAERRREGAGDRAARPGSLAARAWRAAASPFRELAYLFRTFSASLTWPTWYEVAGGLLSKGPAFVLAVAWFANVFLPAHPVAFGLAIGFSLALEVFHGIWINSWQNLQNNIGRQRGVGYQTGFNFFYMQGTAVLMRLITWSVIAGTIAPWTWMYWRDVGLAALLGTFFGTLGYNGLNELYNRGRIRRGMRSGIQQLRDVFFLVAGTFFATSSMGAFWVLFAVQQLLDVTLYLLGTRLKARPILYAADRNVSSTEEFAGMYPVTPGPRPTPLKQALRALAGNPLLLPFVLIGRGLRRLFSRRKA